MPDIFDEISEDLRAERAQRLLKRYAPLLIAAVVLIVAATGGWEIWRWRQSKEDMAASQHYLAAMTMESLPSAAADGKALIAQYDAIARNSPEGYRTLARLQAAALDARNGDGRQALALWNAVATDDSADPLLRDLANLLWCQHQIDTGDPGLLAGRLRALAEPGNPWRPLAEEQLAMLDLRAGKTAEAKTTLTRLAEDVTAPDGVRKRAAALLEQLG
ncbi:MAG TPA: tetratricopeptide repeat protein [Acetobacteraceae bacterium]|nr:tetratricopeptide repeat protein [Acetobacteraceae bacterium]